MRVAVIGGGIAGLTTAWDLCAGGAQVDLYEASAQLGGAVAPTKIAGVRVDAGAEAFATRTPAVAELLASLGLGDRIVSPNPAGAWLQLPEMAAPLPSTGILGIPADPLAADVVRILGETEALASADADRAPMRWSAGQTPSLGEVVEDRLGKPLLSRLVAPITSGVHSAEPYDVSVAAAHPRLYSTMLTCGSLTAAVASLRASAPAGSAVQSLHGGMNTLVTALEHQVESRGGRIHRRTPITDLRQLHTAPDHVVLAVEEHRALQLAKALPKADPSWVTPGMADAQAAQGRRGVALVTLALHAPALDVHPRGTGMLVGPNVTELNGMPLGAKAMTHISAKWDWVTQMLYEQHGPGRHLVRLSYGRVSDDPEAGLLGVGSTDSELLTAAIGDLPALMGVPVSPDAVLDSVVVRWERALPAASAVSRQRAADLEAALAAQRSTGGTGLWVTGAWTAGTGLAQVIPHARSTAAAVLKAMRGSASESAGL